jgi:hypothetical protein
MVFIHTVLIMRRPKSTISFFYTSVVLMVFAFVSMTDNTLAYATPIKNSTIATTTTSSLLDNMQTKKVRVGDIDIAYKIFGKGKPLSLIAGSGANMDMWDLQS